MMRVILSNHAAITRAMTVALDGVYGQLDPEEPVTDAPDPGPRRVPRPLRLWLARLRLLEAVPFSHLVADAALLPPESIRFFHLDRGWTDALVEGALSVGTATTSDRAVLDAVYPVIRPEVDEAERLVRLVGWEPGKSVPSGDAGPITGFLLRSRMVSGWPALSVRAYAIDNLRPGSGRPRKDDDEVDEADRETYQKLTLLRFERLAPAVLLVLFDGLPRVIHIEEPRAGIQFGVDSVTTSGGRTSMRVRLRDVLTSEKLILGDIPPSERPPGSGSDLSAVATVGVPFREGAPGVVHFGALRTAVARVSATNVHAGGSAFDAAELAMQLLQFPYRSVYGDQTVSGGADPVPFDDLFRPVVGYRELSGHFTNPVGNPLPVPPKRWTFTAGGP
jgi:hypothetical protein